MAYRRASDTSLEGSPSVLSGGPFLLLEPRRRCSIFETFDLAVTKGEEMSLYMVVHGIKIDAGQFSAAMESDDVGKLAKAMAEGQTPAKCLKSWNPLPHGNTDTFICLWEADNPDDISATLGAEMLTMLTCDPMQVDEIDWAKVAATS